MKPEDILIQFKLKNPELVQLKPKIKIIQIASSWNNGTKEEINYNPTKLQIEVAHLFVFDNRLIPKKFMGIEIINSTKGAFPKPFPSSNAGLPLEEWYAPEHYEKFVDNNLDLIKRKLLKSNLTREEALDALTGGFKNHKKWCKQLRRKKIVESINEISFFSKLLQKTKEAYNNSDIKKNPRNKGWGYSVTSTMILKNKPVIVGFNSKVNTNSLKGGNEPGVQEEYPFRTFESNYDELGSLKQTIKYFHEYYPQATQGMQSNFCFFKSERENQISDKDLELSAGLFNEYIVYSRPSIIISFSEGLVRYLKESGKLMELERKQIISYKTNVEPLVGKFQCENGKTIDFVYLPHPNCSMTKEARHKAWQYCFSKYLIDKTG